MDERTSRAHAAAAEASATPIDTERLRTLASAAPAGTSEWVACPWDDMTAMPAGRVPERAPSSGRDPHVWVHSESVTLTEYVAEALTALPALLDEVDRLRFAAGELLTAAFILRDNPGEDWAKERFRGGAAGMASLLPNPDAAPARGELPRPEGEG